MKRSREEESCVQPLSKRLDIGTKSAVIIDGYLYYGDLIDDKPHGYGKIFYKDSTLWYDGNWKDGKKHGQGSSYSGSNNTLYYKGEWENDEINGYGKMYTDEGKPFYTGEFKNSKFHGKGTLWQSGILD